MMGKEAVFLKPFDPTDYADPLFGVGSATSAGPTLPSGSIHPSPETLEKDCGGYLRDQPIIGFGHAYTSGSGGTKCYGNFLLSPTVDRAELDHSRRAVFATTENYYLHGTRVEEIIFHLGNGRELRITGENVGEKKSTFNLPLGRDASLIPASLHTIRSPRAESFISLWAAVLRIGAKNKKIGVDRNNGYTKSIHEGRYNPSADGYGCAQGLCCADALLTSPYWQG
jgi:hypothetical protein